jgi:hypothetical protein
MKPGESGRYESNKIRFALSNSLRKHSEEKITRKKETWDSS